MLTSTWSRWLRRPIHLPYPLKRQAQRPRQLRSMPGLEALESRTLLSVNTLEPALGMPGQAILSNLGQYHPNAASSPIGFTPQQIRHGYGIDLINFGGIVGNGAGQLIAIVDAYDDPKFVNSTDPNFKNSDLHKFDKQFGLPDPPNFTKVAADGSNNYPTTDPGSGTKPVGGWETEEALDIEWAHAVAPAANIIVVEADSNSNEDLADAIDTARQFPAVSIISMSFGGSPFNQDYSVLETPGGHQGITFVASSGDNGITGDAPASAPTVVAVGGTNLTLNQDNTWSGETGWSGSGGGLGLFSTPDWQKAFQDTGSRTSPDVAFVAGTGVAVYDSFNFGSNTPWVRIGGTSLSAPCWAGLIAIADQGRVQNGMGTLDGASETLPTLYALPSSDFHDITSGFNGKNAGPGYDLVTGRGSPIANLLVPDLAGVPGELSYVAPQSMTQNHLILTVDPSGTILEVFNGGNLVASKPLATTSAVHIYGADNNDDLLSILYYQGRFTVPVTFDAGTGGGEIFINDSANPDPEIVTVTKNSVSATGVLAGWSVNYNSSLTYLSVIVGLAQNTVNISSTSVTTHVETGGNDLVHIGNAGKVNGILGELFLKNTAFASGTNSLIVDDSADKTGHTVTLDSYDLPNDTDFGLIKGLAPAPISFKNLDFISLSLLLGLGNDTVNVLDIEDQTRLDGGAGHDTVHVGSGGRTALLGNDLIVRNSQGSTKLVVDDSQDTSDRQLFMSTNNNFGTPFGSVFGLAPGTIYYDYAAVSALTIDLGSGQVAVDILATGVNTTLDVSPTAATIGVGNAGSMQEIVRDLTIFQSPFLPGGRSSLTLDDSRDFTQRNVTLSNIAASALAPAADRVAGCAPANITYSDSALVFAKLITSLGDDVVRVQGIGVPTFLDSGDGHDSVRLGNKGSVQGILAPLTLENTPSTSTLTLDDSADTTDRTVTLKNVLFTPVGEGPSGMISGLAPGTISYEYADFSLVSMFTGNAQVGINVLATGVPTNLDISYSTASVVVGDNGSVQKIKAALTVYRSLILAAPHVSSLLVDDSADLLPRTITLNSLFRFTPIAKYYETLVGLAPATISYLPAALSSVTIQAGGGGNTIDVQAVLSGPSVSLHTGTGDDMIRLSSLDNFQSALVLGADRGNDSVIVNDQTTKVAKNFGIKGDALTRTGSTAIAYDGTLETLVINGGSGGNTFNAAPSPDTAYLVNGGSKNDILNVDLTGVSTPDLMFSTPTSGKWVFGDRQPIAFTSIGTVTPADALPYHEDFSDGIADHFVPQLGKWTASGGHYTAAPAQGADAISTLLLTPLPNTFVVGVLLSMSPAAGGFDSDGFLIFDYHSPTDFKYAGARQSTGKWVIGQRSASGWHDLAVLSEAIAADTFYSMALLVNGNSVTLEVNGQVKLFRTFASPLNGGSVGLGTQNAISQFDNAFVQVPG